MTRDMLGQLIKECLKYKIVRIWCKQRENFASAWIHCANHIEANMIAKIWHLRLGTYLDPPALWSRVALESRFICIPERNARLCAKFLMLLQVRLALIFFLPLRPPPRIAREAIS